MATFNATFECAEGFQAGFQSSVDFKTIFENTVKVGVLTPYEGDYEFTPSKSEQLIKIEGKTALANIVINPIPQNYGLITWDGLTLTVS